MAGSRPSPPAKVLVLGHDTKSFLSVVRSFGRYGLEVHVGWANDSSVALRSRYIRRVHDLPKYSADNDDWLLCLTALFKKENYALIIPTNDSSLLPLQARRHDLGGAPVYLLSDLAFEVTQSKEKTHNLARSLGIPVPEQLIVSPQQADAYDAAMSGIGLPLVLKPISSFTAADTQSRNTVTIVRGPDELRKELKTLDRYPQLIVQQFFVGSGVGVEILAKDGRGLFAFQHIRIHEFPSGGGTYRRSTKVDSELLAAVTRMVEQLKYTGVAMFEFRVNANSGKWVLLEVNGRFWGSLPLAVAAGADFPLYLYQMLVEDRTVFGSSYRMNVHARDLTSDLAWQRWNWSADRSDVTLTTEKRAKCFTRPLLNLLLGREHVDTIAMDDLGPGIQEIADLGRRSWNGVRSRLLARPFFRRVNYGGLPTLEPSSRILFVCKGNICRSPFAHLYLQTFYDAPHVASAGYYPVPDRKSPQTAQQVAAEFGVDLSLARSRVVTREMIESCDVVIGFDVENMETLRRKFPEFRSKMALLGDLARAGKHAIISDPYGRDSEGFRHAYYRISALLDAACARIGFVKSPDAVRNTTAIS